MVSLCLVELITLEFGPSIQIPNTHNQGWMIGCIYRFQILKVSWQGFEAETSGFKYNRYTIWAFWPRQVTTWLMKIDKLWNYAFICVLIWFANKLNKVK